LICKKKIPTQAKTAMISATLPEAVVVEQVIRRAAAGVKPFRQAVVKVTRQVVAVA
jgi:hypothetical protein